MNEKVVKELLKTLKYQVNKYLPPCPDYLEIHPNPNVDMMGTIEALEFELFIMPKMRVEE